VTMDDDVTMIFNFLFYFAKSTPICGWLETLLVLGRECDVRRGAGLGEAAKVWPPPWLPDLTIAWRQGAKTAG
jgi:hypothetical protein